MSEALRIDSRLHALLKSSRKAAFPFAVRLLGR